MSNPTGFHLTLAAFKAPPSGRTGAAVRVSETEEQRTTDSVHAALLTAPAEAALTTHYKHNTQLLSLLLPPHVFKL